MKKDNLRLTAAQFAQLHGVNKRTLHYYDDIGLFSPRERGENGYRYYDAAQSMDFEYIRMLKELNMSIEQIADYYAAPSADKFLHIAEQKQKEIDLQIEKLQAVGKVLSDMKEKTEFCQKLKEQKICVEKRNPTELYLLPFDFADDDLTKAFLYIKDKWSIEQMRMGIGSFISLDKVKRGDFEKYDGLFSPVLRSGGEPSITLPAGNYLCGWQTGLWDKLPNLYEAMLDYAERHGLRLTGCAYEQGINEFTISSPEQYTTKITIKIDGEA